MPNVGDMYQSDGLTYVVVTNNPHDSDLKQSLFRTHPVGCVPRLGWGSVHHLHHPHSGFWVNRAVTTCILLVSQGNSQSLQSLPLGINFSGTRLTQISFTRNSWAELVM